MSRTMHFRLDIRGFLLNATTARDLSVFQHNDGRPMTRGEAIDFLIDHIRKGHDYLPVGDCDNFDWKKGMCQGHPQKPQLTVVEGTQS
jgi:hypothetical protein